MARRDNMPTQMTTRIGVVVGDSVPPYAGMRVEMNDGFLPRGAGTITELDKAGTICSVIWDDGVLENDIYVGHHHIFALVQIIAASNEREDRPLDHIPPVYTANERGLDSNSEGDARGRSYSPSLIPFATSSMLARGEPIEFSKMREERDIGSLSTAGLEENNEGFQHSVRKEVRMEKERQIATARHEATKENKEESALQERVFRYLKDGPLQPLQQGSQSVTPMRERPGERDTRVPWNKKNDVPPRPLKWENFRSSPTHQFVPVRPLTPPWIAPSEDAYSRHLSQLDPYYQAHASNLPSGMPVTPRSGNAGRHPWAEGTSGEFADTCVGMGIVENFVDYVTMFGPAYNSGKIRQGDKIISVGGMDMGDHPDRIVACIAPHEGSKALVRVAVLNTLNAKGERSERQGVPVEVDLLRWPKAHMQLYQDLHKKIQDLDQQSTQSAAIGVDLVNMLRAIKAREYAEEVRLRRRVMQLEEGASDGKKGGAAEKTRDLEQEIIDLKKKVVEKDSLMTHGEKLLKAKTDRILQLEEELKKVSYAQVAARQVTEQVEKFKAQSDETLKAARAENEGLLKNLMLRNDEIQALRNAEFEKSKIESKVRSLLAECEALKTLLNSLQFKLSVQETLMATQDEDLRVLREDATLLKARLKERDEEFKEMEHAYVSIKALHVQELDSAAQRMLALQKVVERNKHAPKDIIEKLQGVFHLEKAYFNEQTQEQDKLITALQQKLQAKQQEHSEIVKKLQGTSSLEKAYFQEQTRERDKLIDALQQKLQAKQQELSEIVEKLQGASYLEKANFQEQTAEKDKLIDALQQKLQAKENELSELRRQLQEVTNSMQRERERDVGHKSSIEPATNLADKLPLPLPPSDLSHPFRNSPILPSLMPAKLPANFALSTPPHLTRDFSPEKSNPHPPPSQQALAPPAPLGGGKGVTL